MAESSGFTWHAKSKQSFKSFAMRDGLLTISNIILSHLQDPDFAILSVCCDEAIPLVAVMQLSGFRSVIGYMRSVNEDVAGQITPALYNYFDDDSHERGEKELPDSSSHDV
ncbi:hypothetical protein P692DRAFT_201929002 [Suillus brevipes Sb2]|nr:hypothetical protein P692DRAFT_201929002 [Suillus brevipes Sb2]